MTVLQPQEEELSNRWRGLELQLISKDAELKVCALCLCVCVCVCLCVCVCACARCVRHFRARGQVCLVAWLLLC